MREKTDQDQDQKLGLNSESEKDVLNDVDALIAAEDPDFYAKVNSIKIDSSLVADIGIDGRVDIEKHLSESIIIYLKKPFEFRANTRPVVIFWIIFILSVAAISFAWINKKNLLQQGLFITSLEKLGSKTNSYNPNTETEAFYDNPRFAKNLISMSQVHSNLRPSENSGNNPMLAFEVTVEGLSSDAIVEIKDRQAEFKDLLARATEQKTYDELVLADGKRALCDQFRELLNASLTRGQVRRVLLKTFILKP